MTDILLGRDEHGEDDQHGGRVAEVESVGEIVVRPKCCDHLTSGSHQGRHLQTCCTRHQRPTNILWTTTALKCIIVSPQLAAIRCKLVLYRSFYLHGLSKRRGSKRKRTFTHGARTIKTHAVLPNNSPDYKSSAVAEMGNRLATIDMGRNDMGRKVGDAVPISVGELGPHLTQWRLGRGLPSTKWHLDPSNRLATIHQRYRQTGHRSR